MKKIVLILLSVCLANQAFALTRTKPPVFMRLNQIPQNAVSSGIPDTFPHEVETKLQKTFPVHERNLSFIPQHYITEDHSTIEENKITAENAQLTTSLLTFSGIKDTGKRPADPILAAGPDHLMAAVNNTVAIFSKDGTKIFQTTFFNWFSSLPESAGMALFDPKVIYDEYSGHFIFLCDAASGGTRRSFYLFSVSKTSDATGEWAFWALDMQLNNQTHADVYADFPGLGFDTQAIYLTGNIFNLVPFHYSYAKIRVLKKSEVYNFLPLSWNDFWNFKDATRAKAINVQPAQNFGTVSKEYLLSSNADHGNKLTLWSITDPTGLPALHKRSVLVSSYHFPPGAPQRGGPTLINTGDDGLTNVVGVNDVLYAANSISYDWGSGPVAAMRYYSISTTGTVLQEVTYGKPGYYYYYPVVMVDSQNNVAIAFNRSSNKTFAGIFFTERKADDPPGFLQSATRIKAGVSYYNESNDGLALWGDFNGIAVDQDDNIWMFSMFARSLHHWGTRGARFHF
jgi:hypothetical protein